MESLSELNLDNFGIRQPLMKYAFIVRYYSGAYEGKVLAEQTTNFIYDLVQKKFESTIPLCANGDTEDVLRQFAYESDANTYIDVDHLNRDGTKNYTVRLKVKLECCEIDLDYSKTGVLNAKLSGKIKNYSIQSL
jgi:hypothetical protein